MQTRSLTPAHGVGRSASSRVRRTRSIRCGRTGLELALSVHHRDTRFTASDHLPRHAFLVGTGCDCWRIGVHDRGHVVTRGRGQQALDRENAREPTFLQDGKIVRALELRPGERRAHVADKLFRARGRGRARWHGCRAIRNPGSSMWPYKDLSRPDPAFWRLT